MQKNISIFFKKMLQKNLTFSNAVSDMAYHGKPLRQTKNYNENLFRKTIDGLPVLDKTYQMVLSA